MKAWYGGTNEVALLIFLETELVKEVFLMNTLVKMYIFSQLKN